MVKKVHAEQQEPIVFTVSSKDAGAIKNNLSWNIKETELATVILRSVAQRLQAQSLSSSLPAQQLFTKSFKMKVSILLC